MQDLGILRGLITLLTLSTFLGICWWAYRSGNRARFEADGRLAFGDEEPLPASAEQNRKSQEIEE
jgi:cbb3-type cytochrome oxidase subunit 3